MLRAGDRWAVAACEWWGIPSRETLLREAGWSKGGTRQNGCLA